MRGLFEGAVYSEGVNYSRKYGIYIYSRFISRDNIFANFTDLLLCAKILFANITINQS